ncbi:MAG: dihydrofolate reductase family protein [Gemmobacter sp.]
MHTLPEAHVFIATSLDGYIAAPDGGIGWLTGLPVPTGEDHGYAAFIAGIDAVLMGRATYDTVLGFGDWPFKVPVMVLSRSLTDGDLRADLAGRVRIEAGGPRAALDRLGADGARRVYLDGGQVISAALREGLVTRMTVTRVPVLLGGGLPLFGQTGRHGLHHVETRVWAHGFVQSVYSLPVG